MIVELVQTRHFKELARSRTGWAPWFKNKLEITECFVELEIIPDILKYSMLVPVYMNKQGRPHTLLTSILRHDIVLTMRSMLEFLLLERMHGADFLSEEPTTCKPNHIQKVQHLCGCYLCNTEGCCKVYLRDDSVVGRSWHGRLWYSYLHKLFNLMSAVGVAVWC